MAKTLYERTQEEIVDITDKVLDAHNELPKFYEDDARMYVDSYLEKNCFTEFQGYIEIMAAERKRRKDRENFNRKTQPAN